MQTHKIRGFVVVSGALRRVVVVCGARSGSDASESWGDVTCKNCLRRKPRKAKEDGK